MEFSWQTWLTDEKWWWLVWNSLNIWVSRRTPGYVKFWHFHIHSHSSSLLLPLPSIFLFVVLRVKAELCACGQMFYSELFPQSHILFVKVLHYLQTQRCPELWLQTSCGTRHCEVQSRWSKFHNMTYSKSWGWTTHKGLQRTAVD